MAYTRHIHWATPANILGAFVLALAFAVGHHSFYKDLSGQPAPSGDYIIAGRTSSRQQTNIAAGTAFALLFRSAVAFAVATSYTQLFWRVLKTSRKATRVAEVDAAYSLLGNLLDFFSLSTWRLRYVVLVPVAVIFWLLPLASIFTPATLSVRSQRVDPDPSTMMSVPHFDFVNSNFFSSSPSDKAGMWDYHGPSTIVQRIANTVANEGRISIIAPPKLNSSWSYDFWGPAMDCHDVLPQDRTRIADNYLSTLASSKYYSWRSNFDMRDEDTMPYVRIGSVGLAGITSLTNTASETPMSLIVAVAPEIPDNIYNKVLQPEVEAEHYYTNMTIVRCTLYNASYALHFRYLDGAQSVTKARPRKLADFPMLTYSSMRFPSGDHSWDGRECPADSNNCTIRWQAEMASYQAIQDSFFNLLTGEVFLNATLGSDNAAVSRTPLIETEAFAFFSEDADGSVALQNSGAFVGKKQPRRQFRGSVAEVAEELFENITISLLSEPWLQPNTSSPSYTPFEVEVFHETHANVYSYDAKTLWIAYGVALFFAAVAVLAGTTAMWLNGVAYDNTFSTILRATYIGDATSSGLDGSRLSSNQADDGSRPLPKDLAKATVVVKSCCRNAETESIESAPATILVVPKSAESPASRLSSPPTPHAF